MSLLLKNALIQDTQSPHNNKKKDIFIRNGIIEDFKSQKSDRLIDCSNMIVTPGFCDLNSNFCDPGLEYKEDILSGSNAASFGGFTDVNLISGKNLSIQTKGDVEYYLTKAIKAVDLHVSGAVSIDTKGENLTEMIDLMHAGALSFSDGDKPISNSKLLLKALQYSNQIDLTVFQNARDRSLSSETQMHEGLISTGLGMRGEPSISEEITINRDLNLLKYSGGKIHFSMISTAEGVDLIRKAKKKGVQVTCDVSIHHLLFTDFNLTVFDTTYKNLPPFRSESDRKALVKGILDGTIDAISSNHRPQDQESKKLEFDLADPGSTSLQTFCSSLLKLSSIPLELLIERVTIGPRRILNLDPISITKGSLAKLTVLDRQRAWTLDAKTNLSKSSNSPFWESNLSGKVYCTINRSVVTIHS